MVYFEVTAKRGLRIRELPQGDSEILDAMPAGMRVRRVDELLWAGDWYKISAEFSDRYRVVGYAHRRFLAPIDGGTPPEEAEPALPPPEPPPSDDLFRVGASSLNLREEPNTSSKVLSSMPNGTTVTRVSASGPPGWWQVTAPAGLMTETGYVASKFLRPLNPSPATRYDLSRVPDLSPAIANVKLFVGDAADELDETLLRQLNNVMTEYGINANAKRFNHFMAQIAHESKNFRKLEEDLSYSKERLWEVFRGRFESLEEAADFEWQPERIANRVYSHKIGNGDEASGDGWKYRGRGYIQLTGRNNYRTIGKRIKVNLEEDPDQLSKNRVVALKVAADYWDYRGLNALADQDDIDAVTLKINTAAMGIDHRREMLRVAKSIWGI